jgi:hypothetical protein
MKNVTEELLATAGDRIICTRCAAKSKRSGEQCKKPAMRGKAVCDFHGGRSTGAKTSEGKARAAAAHTTHGCETQQARAERSAALARISQLEDAMQVLKMTTMPRTRGRKAKGYIPVKSIQDVIQMALDDLLHLNKGVTDKR